MRLPLPLRWLADLASRRGAGARGGGQVKARTMRGLARPEDLEDRRLLAASLVLDIKSGAGDSAPAAMANLGGIAIFRADDGVNGAELWRSDNTAAGTFLLKDIYAGSTLVGSPSTAVPNSSNPNRMTTANGLTYFAADDGANGVELWKTDGTTAGTALVKDVAAGSTASTPANLTVVNGVLFFTADDGVNGAELWKTDGSAVGTVLVKNIRSAGGSSPANLTNVNGTLYFSADDGVNGVELWKSDGTTAGTNIVTNVKIGSGGSNPTGLVNVNGTLFFAADDGVNGIELWKSNGTSAGTVLVANIAAGANGSNPNSLVNVNGTLFFAASDGSNGVELWKSDGTLAGTVLVKNIATTAGTGSDPANLTNVNGTLFFRANDGASGAELWKSDGTTAGTVLVKDIRAGALGSTPSVLTKGNDLLYFSADDGVNGVELWKSDGTTAGTVLDTNIRSTPAAGSPSNPLEIMTTAATLFLQANNGVAGAELFSLALPNAAPVSANDAYLFELNVALNVTAPGVLANDADPENNSLTAVLVSGPANGALTLNANGSFGYVPNASFNGRDAFTYRANDGTSSSALVATVTVSSRTYLWIENLYVNMLGRARASVGTAEVNSWLSAMGGGATRADVVNAMLGSDEYRANLVSGYYLQHLARTPSAGESSYWVGVMRAGVTAEGVRVSILSSLEFYRRGTTDTGFVGNLYSHLLGRTGSPTETGFWIAQLLAGVPRSTVTIAILSSAEARTVQINALYSRYLGRTADAGGATFWQSQMAAGQSITAVEAALAASLENFNATAAV